MRISVILILALGVLLIATILYFIALDLFSTIDCNYKPTHISNAHSKKSFYSTIYSIDTSTMCKHDYDGALFMNREFVTIFNNPSIHLEDAIYLLEHEYAPIMRIVAIRCMDNLNEDDCFIFLDKASILFDKGILNESEFNTIMNPQFRNRERDKIISRNTVCKNRCYERVIFSSRSSFDLKYEAFLHRFSMINYRTLSHLAD